jgi:LDH2 family malate/lactate/ureidoglycolate dehydrogenase
MAVDLSRLDTPATASGTVEAILEDLQARYPGQRTLETRRQNLEQGIPVEPSIFELVRSL